MGRLFGTDGARGVANTELTCELAMQIGRAAALVLADGNNGRRPVVMIGKDTRASGDMLEGALTAGLCSVGADVVLLGVVPTPAVAYLVTKYGVDAGIMISASHNPCEYNGIKIFSGTGYKLPDDVENEIEAIVLDNAREIPAPTGGSVGMVTRNTAAVDEYIEHVASTIDVRLDGLRIALDCANGSSSATAAKLFTALGANFEIFNSTPDGVNINEKCGSTHIEGLQQIVREQGFDAGFAFDGDADRCLAVDNNGKLVDGDYIMALLAEDMTARGVLSGNAIVGTILTNMGFHKFCAERGMKFVAAKVGDRYVLEEMRKNGYNLGGEQSGHIIFLDYCTTGDGQLTAVQICGLLARSGKKFSEFTSLITPYPQTMVNVRVTPEGKAKLSTCEAVNSAVSAAENELGDSGRIIVRMSGTEPLIRVMTEGENEQQIIRIANELADVIKTHLG
ncbi:MAG: phosphoglucosamine mutase [Acutalibacteraceae bacterium]